MCDGEVPPRSRPAACGFHTARRAARSRPARPAAWRGQRGGAGGRWLIVLLVCLVGTSLSAGCHPRKTETASLTLAGSTSVQPFAELLAEAYMSQHPGQSINVQGGGSSAGIEAALSGVAQIGMSSRQLLPGEKALLKAVLIAQDALAVVVHPSNPVGDFTEEQVRGIFTGQLTDWSQVGGAPGAIHVIMREEGSGTRASFEDMLMDAQEPTVRAIVQDSNGSVRETVAQDPAAVGYISLGLVDDRVKAVSIEGMVPSVDNVLAGKYRLVRPFLFLFSGEPRGEAKAFLDFVLGPGQAMLRHEGLIPARRTEGAS